MFLNNRDHEYKNLSVSTISLFVSGENVLGITCLMLKYRFFADDNAVVSSSILLLVPASGVPAQVEEPGAAFVVVMAKSVESAGVPSPKNGSSAVS